MLLHMRSPGRAPYPAELPGLGALSLCPVEKTRHPSMLHTCLAFLFGIMCFVRRLALC